MRTQGATVATEMHAHQRTYDAPANAERETEQESSAGMDQSERAAVAERVTALGWHVVGWRPRTDRHSSELTLERAKSTTADVEQLMQALSSAHVSLPLPRGATTVSAPTTSCSATVVIEFAADETAPRSTACTGARP